MKIEFESVIMKIEFETYVVLISFITSFFAVFLSNGIIIGVPAIAQEFAMNNVIQNWVPTIFFLVVAVFTVPAGQISGKFGVKKSLLAGVIVYLIASIGACLSISTETFLIFRILQGAGVAFLNVSAMAMVVQAVKPQNRGKALGFTVTGVYLATSLSPVICGFLVHNLGWRSMFYFVIRQNRQGRIHDLWNRNSGFHLWIHNPDHTDRSDYNSFGNSSSDNIRCL